MKLRDLRTLGDQPRARERRLGARLPGRKVARVLVPAGLGRGRPIIPSARWNRGGLLAWWPCVSPANGSAEWDEG